MVLEHIGACTTLQNFQTVTSKYCETKRKINLLLSDLVGPALLIEKKKILTQTKIQTRIFSFI
jgi:hypothetical protein